MRIYYIHCALSFCFAFPLAAADKALLQRRACCDDAICSDTAGPKNLGDEGPPDRSRGSLFVRGGNG